MNYAPSQLLQMEAKSEARARFPRLRMRLRATSNTGIPGVSYAVEKKRCRSYFWASFGRKKKAFRIESLGRAEAFRRALKWRAERELAARTHNEQARLARHALMSERGARSVVLWEDRRAA